MILKLGVSDYDKTIVPRNLGVGEEALEFIVSFDFGPARSFGP